MQESIKPFYNFKITKKECRPKLLGRRDNLLEEIYITLKKVVRVSSSHFVTLTHIVVNLLS